MPTIVYTEFIQANILIGFSDGTELLVSAALLFHLMLPVN